MTNNKFKIHGCSILLLIAIICIGICFVKLPNVYYEQFLPIIAVVLFCICFILLYKYIEVSGTEINVIYPFRLFYKSKFFVIADVSSVLYIVGGRGPNLLRISMKNKRQISIYVDFVKRSTMLEILHFFESKGIAVEVKGTENNSINDLK